MAEEKLDVIIAGRDDLSPALSQIESRLIRFVGAVSSAYAALRIGAFPITSAADYERELANVRKTTNFTARETSLLNRELLALSARVDVSTIDLAKIAAAAGQQGLGKAGVEGVVAFTESVSRMASVLDVTAEQAGADIGKIINIFKLSMDQVENAVSAFNETSNNSTAEGEQLLDVVKRIGDAAGLINLQESLGLAATGIDFGLSPEVVGTSFTKIFLNMRAKAEEFGQLIYGNTTDATDRWLADLNDGGIAALEKYLARLRQLDTVSQANIIRTLSGEGRIFALVNKLVQDARNQVLQKDLAFAKDGFISGNSAIKEQATVLETLKAQTQILKNNVFALGARTGEQLLEPLTRYVVQLSTTLQNPAVISFFEALGAGMLELINALVQAVQFVADLNVNWENLIVVLKVFLGLKFLEFFTRLATRLPGISLALQTIATSAQASGEAQTKAAGDAVKANTGLVASYNALRDAIRAKAAADTEAFAKRQAQVQAEAALNASILESEKARAAVDIVDNDISRARPAATNAERALQNARIAANAEITAIEQARQERVETAERAHAANMAAIQAEFNGKRTAADKANRDALYAAEQTHHRRSLAGINSYYTRRLQAAQASTAQVIALAEAEAQAVGDQLADLERRRAASVAQVDRSIRDMNRTAGRVAETTDSLRKASLASTAASSAMMIFGAAVRFAGVALSFLSRAVMGLAVWGTIAYMVADWLGWLDKLPAALQRVTDWVGLSSEAQRREAQEAKNSKEALEQKAKAIQELTQQYQAYLTAQGRLDPTKADGIFATATNAETSDDAKTKSLIDLSGLAEAARLERERLTKELTNFPDLQNQSRKNFQELSAQMNALNTQLIETEKKRREVMGTSLEGVFADRVEDLRNKMRDLAVQYDDASARANAFKESNKAALEQQLATATQNEQQLRNYIAGIFTETSADLFTEFVAPMQAAKEEAIKLKTEQAALEQQLLGTQEGEAENRRIKDEISQRTALIAEQYSRATALGEQFEKVKKELLDTGKATPALLNSISYLQTIATLSLDKMTPFISAIKDMRKEGIALSGNAAPTPSPASTTGTDQTESAANRKAESEARRLAKAKFALRKAQNDQELALMREHNNQMLNLDQQLYEQGLISIADYFTNRQRLQVSTLDAEIRARELDLEDLRKKEQEVKTKADRISAQAEQVNVQTDIDVLRAQRGALIEQVARERMEVEDQFRERVQSTQIDFAGALAAGDMDDFFFRQLNVYTAQWRKFLDQLRATGGAENEALAVQIEKALKLDALARTLDQIDNRMSRDYSRLGRDIERINILKENGVLNEIEAEVAAQNVREASAVQIMSHLGEMEDQLGKMRGTVAENSDDWVELVDRIDEARLQLQRLRGEVDATAKQINDSIRGNLAASLTELLNGSESSITDSLRRMLTNVSNNILSTINQNIADNLLDSLLGSGALGDGGIGGVISGLLQKGNKPPTGSETDPVNVKLAGKDSGSLSNSVEKLFKGVDTDAAAEDGAAKVGGMFDRITDNLGSLFSDLLGNFSSLFNGLGSGLSDIFSGILSSLGGGGGGMGGLFSTIASFFHSGGTVGSTFDLRSVHPAVFDKAIRYHTGGIAGLAPNEVPAILQKGEEVLTDDDPRHIANGGAGGGNTNVEITINNSGVSGKAVKSSGDPESAQLGKMIETAVLSIIQRERRPNGLLDPNRR